MIPTTAGTLGRRGWTVVCRCRGCQRTGERISPRDGSRLRSAEPYRRVRRRSSACRIGAPDRSDRLASGEDRISPRGIESQKRCIGLGRGSSAEAAGESYREPGDSSRKSAWIAHSRAESCSFSASLIALWVGPIARSASLTTFLPSLVTSRENALTRPADSCAARETRVVGWGVVSASPRVGAAPPGVGPERPRVVSVSPRVVPPGPRVISPDQRAVSPDQRVGSPRTAVRFRCRSVRGRPPRVVALRPGVDSSRPRVVSPRLNILFADSSTSCAPSSLRARNFLAQSMARRMRSDLATAR